MQTRRRIDMVWWPCSSCDFMLYISMETGPATLSPVAEVEPCSNSAFWSRRPPATPCDWSRGCRRSLVAAFLVLWIGLTRPYAYTRCARVAPSACKKAVYTVQVHDALVDLRSRCIISTSLKMNAWVRACVRAFVWARPSKDADFLKCAPCVRRNCALESTRTRHASKDASWSEDQNAQAKNYVSPPWVQLQVHIMYMTQRRVWRAGRLHRLFVELHTRTQHRLHRLMKAKVILNHDIHCAKSQASSKIKLTFRVPHSQTLDSRRKTPQRWARFSLQVHYCSALAPRTLLYCESRELQIF